jgi:hypothetical protein
MDIPENVKHVYDELTGKVQHDRLGAAPAPLDYLPRREPSVNASLPTVLRNPGGE